MFKWATFVSIFANFFSYCFVMRWNLKIGISDIYFMIFDDVVLHTLMLAFTILPAMVLFAKITPRNIEGTCFAFITGTSSFCRQFIQPMIGLQLNKFTVGVTQSNLTNFHTLCGYKLFASFIPFFFLWMIPTNEEIVKI